MVAMDVKLACIRYERFKIRTDRLNIFINNPSQNVNEAEPLLASFSKIRPNKKIKESQ